MSYYQEALEMDRLKNVPKSIELYELSIKNKENIADAYLNLIVMLWDISFDYGVSSDFLSKNIFSKEQIFSFSERCEELLKEVEVIFTDNLEVRFWSLYINNVVNYDPPLSEESIYDFIKGDPNFDLAYFYLYVFLEKEEYREKMISFKQELQEEPIYKNRYLLSHLID